MTQESELAQVVREAACVIRNWTRDSAWHYFEGDRTIASEGSSEAHHAVGLIDGAAIALGLTPLELLDEVRIAEDD